MDLGIALGSKPQVLLLDEPLAGLAAAERERVSNLVKNVAANIPVLIVEHDIDRVLGFSHRVTVMNQGEVLMAGTPDEVRTDRRVQEIYTGTGTPPVTSRVCRARRPARRSCASRRVNAFYGKSHILNDATLDVREGEIVALLGRNGAGKSTLLKTLAGLVPPASGTIEYEGRNIAGMPAPDIARVGIGYVPQGRGLFAGMTVAENLALGRLARKTDGSNGVVWSEEKIFDYFPRLKERMDIAADYLSGGEQQMVAVARALSGNVKLLLLDEPFEGLAPTVVLELFKVFDQLRRHASIVIVEHNLDLVLALADRVFALERGAVFHQGPAAPLLTDLDYRKKIFVAVTKRRRRPAYLSARRHSLACRADWPPPGGDCRRARPPSAGLPTRPVRLRLRVRGTQFLDRRLRNAGFDHQHAGPRGARPERDREMLRMPGRRVDRFLHIHIAVDVTQKELRDPLVLLIAAGRAPDQIGFAVAQRQCRRQSGARPFARHQRRRMLLVEPEHLGARAETKTELGNDRRGLQPAARRRRRHHVAGLIDDIEMHGVADHFAHAADGRLAGAEAADGGARPLLAAHLHHAAKAADRARAAIPAKPCSIISLRRSAL